MPSVGCTLLTSNVGHSGWSPPLPREWDGTGLAQARHCGVASCDKPFTLPSPSCSMHSYTSSCIMYAQLRLGQSGTALIGLWYSPPRMNCMNSIMEIVAWTYSQTMPFGVDGRSSSDYQATIEEFLHSTGQMPILGGQ